MRPRRQEHGPRSIAPWLRRLRRFREPRRDRSRDYGTILMFFSVTSFDHLARSLASKSRISSAVPLRTFIANDSKRARTSGIATASLIASSSFARALLGVAAGAKNPIQVLTS